MTIQVREINIIMQDADRTNPYQVALRIRGQAGEDINLEFTLSQIQLLTEIISENLARFQVCGGAFTESASKVARLEAYLPGLIHNQI